MMVAITTEPWIFNRLLTLMKSTYGANFQKRAHRTNYLNCWVFVGIEVMTLFRNIKVVIRLSPRVEHLGSIPGL